MQQLLEKIDHDLEETWQSQEIITVSQKVTIPSAAPRLWQRLWALLQQRRQHRKEGVLEYHPAEMHALDYLARNFPDVYVQASNY